MTGPAHTTLNKRQKRFVDAYLQHGDAKKAAKEAGYKDSTVTSAQNILTNSTAVSRAIATGKANGKDA